MFFQDTWHAGSELHSLGVDLELGSSPPGRRQIYHSSHSDGFIFQRGTGKHLDSFGVGQIAEQDLDHTLGRLEQKGFMVHHDRPHLAFDGHPATQVTVFAG